MKFHRKFTCEIASPSSMCLFLAKMTSLTHLKQSRIAAVSCPQSSSEAPKSFSAWKFLRIFPHTRVFDSFATSFIVINDIRNNFEVFYFTRLLIKKDKIDLQRCIFVYLSRNFIEISPPNEGWPRQPQSYNTAILPCHSLLQRCSQAKR